ncbi:MAG: pyrimidine-nucleoside phosphorylase [Oscillospiraceae bacterium]
MRMYDIILKKRDGHCLTDQEIDFVVKSYTKGDIPDYQIAALLMAIYFKGMDKRETATLTLSMAKSGDMFDLTSIKGIKVDKHSTGGVGDKTSLIIGPIVAACGVPVAKMSGRGLGHTGGTVDKLEAFPGFRTSIDEKEFFDIVNQIGISIIGQTGNIAPADKKLYALRDVTATVDNVSLIAASIMSKKLAAGSDAILLDVKTGSGAFMKTLDDSINLAQVMVDIGVANGKNMTALITDMDRPLGNAIGNSLELIEVIDTLSGKGPEDLTHICLELASNMLVLAQKGTMDECMEMAKQAIENGSALAKLREMVIAQGSDGKYVDDTTSFEKAEVVYSVLAITDGYIYKVDTEKCGISSVILGAGRNKKEDAIDFSAGIILKKKTGDAVKMGEEIAVFHTKTQLLAKQAESLFLESIEIRAEKPAPAKLIYAKVTKDSVQRF